MHKSTPPDPLAGFQGLTSMGKGGRGRYRRGEGRRKGMGWKERKSMGPTSNGWG